MPGAVSQSFNWVEASGSGAPPPGGYVAARVPPADGDDSDGDDGDMI